MRRQYQASPFWRKAEKLIATRLRQAGIPCKLVAADGLPWDIVTESGLHVECKAGNFRRGRVVHRKDRKKPKELSSHWQISIARKGVLNESGVDFYVIYLTGCADLRPVYLVMPAPIHSKNIVITLRSLLMQYAGNVNAWHLIREASGRPK
jgi:hypothetical protein